MLEIKEGVVWFDGIELGELINANADDDGLYIGNRGFAFENYPELQTAWDELYPNGKPVPEVPPALPIITDDQKAIDMMKYLMQSDAFLTAVGIPPKPAETEVI